jgi:hypothetical protein
MTTRRRAAKKPEPAERKVLYAELLGALPDGSYGNIEGGRRYLPGAELEALTERALLTHVTENICFVYDDGSRIRHYRFSSIDRSDDYTDADGNLHIDGMVFSSPKLP